MQLLHGHAVSRPVLGLASLDLQVVCAPPAADALQAEESVHVYLALDISGSMQGRPLEAAKAAVAGFAKAALPLPALAGLDLFLFDNRVDRVDLSGLEEGEVEQRVSAIRARGGTSFSAVLTAMREHACSCRPDASHLVVLFTDGQDCCGGVEEALGALKAAMADRRTDWQVHCLGFGPYHDATFLASLTLAGSEAGSFQYVQDASAQEGLLGALDGVLEALQELAGSGGRTRLRGTLRLGSGAAKPVTLRLVQPGTPLQQQATDAEAPTTTSGSGQSQVFAACIDLLDCSAAAEVAGGAPLTLELAADGLGGQDRQAQALQLALSQQEVPAAAAAGAALALLKQLVIRWTHELATGALSQEGMLEVKERLCGLRQGIGELPLRCKEVLRQGNLAAYRASRTQLLEAAQLLNQFDLWVLSPALQGASIANVDIATINHAAYAAVTNASLARLVGKRVDANADLMERVEAQVEEAVSGLQLGTLPEAPDVGCCAISCLDYREALQAGDCMCLALDIERPQAAIADPSRLVIKAIHPTRVTADSFMQAVRFAMGSRSPAQVHGGFGYGVHASVVAGEGRESVTGALPLFINDAHWAVARLRAKPLLGWMCTLSPLGYTEEQLRTVPFLALAQAFRDLQLGAQGGNNTSGAASGATGFRAWVADQALQTCMAVYRSCQGRLRSELFGDGSDGCSLPAEQQAALEAQSAAAATTAAAGGGPVASAPQLQAQASPRRLRFLEGGPAARTLDQVASLEVFLLRLLCAVRHGDVMLSQDDLRRLRFAVLEEELRRRQGRFLHAPLDPASTLGLDVPHAAQAAVERWMAQEPRDYAAAMRGELRTQLEGQAAAMDWGRALGDGRLAQRPEVEALQQVHGAHSRPLLRLVGRVEQACTAAAGQPAAEPWSPPAVLAEWLPAPTLAALLLQNAEGASNAERRQAITAGRYIDPFEHPKQLLGRLYCQALWTEVCRGISQLRSAEWSANAAAMAAAFGPATTLEAAAEAIRGWRLGRGDLGPLFQALLQPGVPLTASKVRLLMSWGLRRLGRLRADQPVKDPVAAAAAAAGAEVGPEGGASGAVADPPGAWVPSRRWVYRFLAVHHREVGLSEALHLFGQCRRVGEAYLRLQYAHGFAAQWAPAASGDSSGEARGSGSG